MNFDKLNKIGGWLMFLVALIVYTLTTEQSVPLWDCGEFLSAAYKLQVVHPPGAPLFLMIGRVFSLFAGGNTENVAFWINMVSAVSSAACVMFTFWITTYFAKRLITATSPGANIAILGAGLVAALTNTFIDTFWFSAVEGEVYAMSSFFTAISFWAVIRWYASEDTFADRWIVFIAFLVGLALGTHMLNLLIIPVIFLAVAFKRNPKLKFIGVIKALAFSALGLMFVMKFIYPGIPWLISRFDYLFVNSFGLPFYSGAIFSLIFIVGLCYAAIKYSAKNYNVHLFFLSAVFVVIGYSSYAMVVIRSFADPAIDMNDPEDPYRFYGYITREQYGDRPLMYGPYFNAQPVDMEVTGQKYFRGKTGYEEGEVKQEYVYAPEEKTLFPRMGATGRPNDDVGYRQWSGMSDVQDQINGLKQNAKTASERDELAMLQTQTPSMSNNLSFFWNYQLGHMYKRYFFWNFVGRFNDMQGMGPGDLDGKWYSGTPLDGLNIKNKDQMPDFYKNQKGKNAYYFLPLILGLLGFYLHLKKDLKSFWLVLTLFLFTGILINVYLNPPPFEPRERDYSLVGSFQTFCIWVGLGVLAIYNFLLTKLKGTSAVIAVVGCTLLVPINMGFQNWDDHDRSGRYIGRDVARNFLEQLDKNAILICNGDNDTYPLWYLQNVEGVRTDVRIINMSLLPTEWYSSVLLNKVMDSEPLPLSLTKEDLEAGSLEGGIQILKDGATGDLETIIKKCLASNKLKQPIWDSPNLFCKLYPDKALAAGVITADQRKLATDTLSFRINETYVTKGDIVLYDFIANMAKQGWKRPLYFTSVSGNDFNGLNNYLQLEGLVYKFVPIKTNSSGGTPQNVNKEKLYTNLIKDYKYYGIKEKKNFFLDDKASYVPMQMKNWAYNIAYMDANEYFNLKNAETAISKGTPFNPQQGYSGPADYVAREKKNIEEKRDKAIKLLNHMRTEFAEPQMIWQRNVIADYGLLYVLLGEKEKGMALLDNAVKQNKQFWDYFFKLYNGDKQAIYSSSKDAGQSIQLARSILEFSKQYGLTEVLTKYEKELTPIASF